MIVSPRVIPIAPDRSLAISTLDLPTRGRCKYPVNEAAPWLHCGAHAPDGVWCQFHHNRVYTIRPRRSRTSEDLAMERRSGLSKTFGGM